MLRPGADFSDGAVIYRAGGTREVSEDVLIIWPTPIDDHGLDQRDFPAFELIAALADWHSGSPRADFGP